MANSTRDTLELHFDIPPEMNERLVAELDALACDGFLEDDDGLKAYISVTMWNADKSSQITGWLKSQNLNSDWKEQRIEAQDWNEPWEKSIQPIYVPPFYIRPSWTPPLSSDEAGIDIVVDPKMSFGTGHHESTRLVLKSIPEMIQANDRVLDAGSGTAVLSIAAVLWGASSVVAFDIDEWAVDNAAENISRNNVSDRVDFRSGTLDTVTEAGFDVILANINRNVLVDYMEEFAAKLRGSGHLVLAGLLIDDKSYIVRVARDAGLDLIGEDHEGVWWSGRFKKT